jgi:hypothetical protein
MFHRPSFSDIGKEGFGLGLEISKDFVWVRNDRFKDISI